MQGLAGLEDRLSVARRRHHALALAWLALIRVLRYAKLAATEIAERVPIACLTVSAVSQAPGFGATADPSTLRPRCIATNGAGRAT